ncbi:MAG TPA: Do family serine endopeptidase [Spirochaetia bacterium]|nr:Do family serine endopeptidase [Spirochaetia bacterium]
MKTHTRMMAATAAIVFLLGASVAASAQNVGSPRGSGTSLGSVQASLRDIAQKVRPAVVEINVTEVIKQEVPQFDSPFDWFFNQNGDGPGQGQGNGQGNTRTFRQSALGSGIIVKRNGDTVYVLTNNHVVAQASDISARLVDGRVFKAKVVGTDPRKDIALVSFTTRDPVSIAELGDSNSLQVGDIVLAVGNPLGFESTVTMGMVSALGRRGPAGQAASYTDYIQTDASINQGNSGGALVNIDGQVVGINTWIAAPSGGSVGLGFAIPINNARPAIDQFIASGHVQYGWLGALIGDIQDQGTFPQLAQDMKLEGMKGAFVLGMYRGSPADRAGLKPGDFVTAVGSTPVTDANQLTQVVGSLEAGKTTTLTVIRLGQSRTLTATIGQRDDQDQVAQAKNLWPGMTVVNITDQIRQDASIPSGVNGVVVGSLVNQDAPAAVAGFRPGDVITAVNGRTVRNMMDFYRALNTERGASFQIVRDGTEITISL